MSEPSFRPATTADLALLVPMMREFYAHESIAFDADVAGAALRGLLEDSSRGQVWVVSDEHGPAGYLAVTFGWSLEYGGRDAFLDEIFLLERLRGRRVGERAIELAVQACREAGVRALHLEVERVNESAQKLYRRIGFVDHDRYLLTKWLTAARNAG